jgi:hypothetical protein
MTAIRMEKQVVHAEPVILYMWGTGKMEVRVFPTSLVWTTEWMG